MAQQLALPFETERPYRMKPGIRDFQQERINPIDLPMLRIYLRDNLRRLRKNKGWNVTIFSIRSELERNTIRSIENGHLPCMLSTFKLMRALGLTVEEVRHDMRLLQ